MRKKGQNCPFLLSVADLRVKGFQKPLVLALLVRYCTGSLASRLTGSLTLTAAALFSRLLEVSLIDGLNVLHLSILPKNNIFPLYHGFCRISISTDFFGRLHNYANVYFCIFVSHYIIHGTRDGY